MDCMGLVESAPAIAGGQYQEAADRLIATHGWRLLGREEFAEQARANLLGGVATGPLRAALHAYSRALHTACSGREGMARQELGYTELHRYLYASALRRYPDICDEAAQLALERTYLGFARCHQAGTFLAFALQQLLDAARVTRRQEVRPDRSLDAPVGADGDETLGERLVNTRHPDPATVVLDDERRAHLARCAAAFLRRHPRAREQLAALWLKYIEGLNDVAISQRLGKPVSSVYVLRSRAIAKLQAEPAWRALARECGIKAEEPPPDIVLDEREFPRSP